MNSLYLGLIAGILESSISSLFHHGYYLSIKILQISIFTLAQPGNYFFPRHQLLALKDFFALRHDFIKFLCSMVNHKVELVIEPIIIISQKPVRTTSSTFKYGSWNSPAHFHHSYESHSLTHTRTCTRTRINTLSYAHTYYNITISLIRSFS